MPTLDQVFSLLLFYKYIIIYPLAIVEGPILSVIVGFLVSTGKLNFFLSFLLVFLGDFTGDTLLYVIGRKSGLHEPPQWLRFLGVTKKRVQVIEKQFLENPRKIFFVGKLTMGPGAAILFAAGVTKYPYKKFLEYNMFISAVKLLILMLIGYFFGQTYANLQKYFDYGALFFVALFIILYVVFVRYTKNLK